MKNIPYVTLKAKGFPCYFIWIIAFSEIYAGIYGIWGLCRHLPKRILDYNRGVYSNTEFQKQNMGIAVATNKILITICRRIPAFILHKRVITS